MAMTKKRGRPSKATTAASRTRTTKKTARAAAGNKIKRATARGR